MGSCAICHADLPVCSYGGLAEPKVLPCGHVYHATCLRRWLTHSSAGLAACPMCRTDIPKPVAPRRLVFWRLRGLQWIDWWLLFPLNSPLVRACHLTLLRQCQA